MVGSIVATSLAMAPLSAAQGRILSISTAALARTRHAPRVTYKAGQVFHAP